MIKTHKPLSKLKAAVIAALILCAAFLTAPANSGTAAAGVDVWGASSGVKIKRDEDIPSASRGPGVINISMAKNEYESAQLIMTAASGNHTYDIQTSALSDGAGGSIAAAEAFHEHYMNVQRVSQTKYTPGWYPDTLIPIAAARSKGELKFSAGNQGIWIKFKTEKSTPAGVYTGSFTLTVDGTPQVIPVSVTVWNFEVADEVNTQSSFMLYYDALTQGERDSTRAMWKTYYDYLLEYRVSAMNLPCGGGIDDFIECVREYYDNPKVSAYNLPYRSYEGNIDVEHMREIMRRLAVACVQDGKDYFSKAYIYNLYTDEYGLTGVKRDKAAYWMPAFNDLKAETVQYFDNKYGAGYLNGVPGLRRSILTVTDLEVTTFQAGFSDIANGMCTGFTHFQTESERAHLRSYFDGDGEELWWYGCIGPSYPYPSYHIDDNLLSSRVLSWMQYDYNIDGNLYFMANMFFGDAGRYDMYPIDEWTLANRNLGGGNVNGDGYLLYPGLRYGIEGPIGTVRLEAIRDGLEEYEYLRYLDGVLEGLASYYNTSDMNVSGLLRGILDTMYSGVLSTDDDEVFLSARRLTAETVLLAQSDKIAVGKTVKDARTAKIEVYMPGGSVINNASLPAGVSLLSQTPQGSFGGYKALFEIQRTYGADTSLKFSYTLSGQTRQFERLVAKAVQSLTDFGNSSAQDYLTVSQGGSFVLGSADSTNAFKFDLVSTTDPIAALTFKPYFGLNSQFVQLIPAGARVLVFEVYNPSNEDVTVSVIRRTAVYDTVDSDALLPAKTWTMIEIPIIGNDALAYRIAVPNEIAGSLPVTRTLYLARAGYVV